MVYFLGVITMRTLNVFILHKMTEKNFINYHLYGLTILFVIVAHGEIRPYTLYVQI